MQNNTIENVNPTMTATQIGSSAPATQIISATPATKALAMPVNAPSPMPKAASPSPVQVGNIPSTGMTGNSAPYSNMMPSDANQQSHLNTTPPVAPNLANAMPAYPVQGAKQNAAYPNIATTGPKEDPNVVVLQH